MIKRRNPAVIAGLLGGLALAVTPVSAHAATFDSIDSPALFIATCVVGGLSFVGMISGISWLIANHRQQRQEQRRLSCEGESASQYERQHSHTINDNNKSKIIFVDTTHSSLAEYKPRHMRALEWNATGAIRVQKVATAPKPARAPLPVRAKSQPTAKAHRKAAHAAKDYEQVAENYLNLLSFRERMASRARGAADVLRERLSGDPMEGLPVIPRADGTVGDVGTSWWTAGVGEQNITHDFGITAIEAEAIPDSFAATKFENSISAVGTSSDISERIAFVDQGIFPEKRTVSELSHKDDWELALEALDKKLSVNPAGVIRDPIEVIPNNQVSHVSAPSRTTGSLKIEAATHVDKLFADIEEEMRKDAAKEEQRPTRELFRLIDGGTNALKRIPTPAESAAEAAAAKASAQASASFSRQEGSYRPRHFSPAPLRAIEA